MDTDLAIQPAWILSFFSTKETEASNIYSLAHPNNAAQVLEKKREKTIILY